MLITQDAILREFCQRATHHEWVAVDTEFMSAGRYYPLLCLVQLALSDGKACAVDMLAPSLDTAPLFHLLHDKNILKIFHASRQDAEIIHQASLAPPAPIFDTQIAAALCGAELNMGFAALLQKQLNIKLDKKDQRAKWDKRPLETTLLNYALKDVLYLCPLYEKLNDQLTQLGRLSWLQEDCHKLSEPSFYELTPHQAGMRFILRHPVRNKLTHYRNHVMKLVAWREAKAQKRNFPRNYILADVMLKQIAMQKPKTRQDLEHIYQALGHKKPRPQTLDDILCALRQKSDVPPTPSHPAVAMGILHQRLEKLQKLLKETANNLKIQPSLIANKNQLEELANHASESPLLAGWRFDVFGKEALTLLGFDAPQ